MTQTQTWLEQMAKKRKRLYAKYGKPLETDHKGEFIAISSDGQTILGDDMEIVAVEAFENFGSGNFVLTRIGHPADGTWPTIHSA